VLNLLEAGCWVSDDNYCESRTLTKVNRKAG